MTKARRRLLSALVVFAISSLLLGTSHLWGASEETAALDAVWARVAQSDAYRFSADIRQTSTPPATVANAGRTSQSTTLFMEGVADLPAESLQLTVWTNGGSVMDPASGVEVRVKGDTATARQGAGQWEEIEGFTGLFAPGGDLMAYTQAAKNVIAHGTTVRETPMGELAVTRYTFDIDGRQLAIYLHDQLIKQAVVDGLPASVQADFTKAYAHMSGTGELWVGADGLPLRQVFNLIFPPDMRDYATTAAITVDFFDFAPLPTLTTADQVDRALRSGWEAVTGPQGLISWAVLGMSVLGVLVVIARRRNRTVYAAVVTIVIASTLAVPLLNSRQVYAYSVGQAAKQARATQLHANAEAQAALQDTLAAPRVNPNRAPLAVAQEQATATDNPSRYADARCESDPDGDADGDSLTNLEECLLGTLLDVADSDGDGADDNFEVTGVVYNGTTWYSDPLYPDSNHDGLPDGKEWFTDADANGEAELDTDGDGTPDIWDDDNDGDGVIDKLDMSPQTSTASTSATVRTFTDADPLELTLDQLEVGELVKVEFQLRPENPAHLWYSQNVLNWPQGDQQGNIQDADGKTFYDIDNTTSPSPNANGDVRMVPMLEITFQEADANLPPAATCTDDDGNTYTCYPLLEDFGISVTTLDDNDSVAYVPLQLVADSTGDANVAFYGRMMYEASGRWSTPHQVRMVWAVQALNDICDEYTNNICTHYSSYNEIQVVHTYYDDWFLTGLHVTEEHSANMALVYEDPVETSKVQPGYDAPFYTDVQFGLLYGLDKTL
ncbi:MAG: hypothetical protein KDE20_11590, partial [Caldilineaceae bacterium]|nr:hypothetical protein [Caldilineaceae bacterium]